MKIDPNKSLRQNLHLNKKSTESAPVVENTFKRVFSDAQETNITARLDQLMEVIEEKAKKLKRNMSMKSLKEYRHAVKEFLKIFTEECMKTDHTYSWQRGSMKSYTIVKKIDESLDTLRELFLEEQKNTLKIVEELDAIRGLLVDLYI